MFLFLACDVDRVIDNGQFTDALKEENYIGCGSVSRVYKVPDGTALKVVDVSRMQLNGKIAAKEINVLVQMYVLDLNFFKVL